MDTFLKTYYFCKSQILGNHTFSKFETRFGKDAPEKDGNANKNISEILDMISISIKKHRIEMW